MTDQESSNPKFLFKFVLPVFILLAGLAGAFAMIALKPNVERRPPDALIPSVEIEVVRLDDYRMSVTSQGTVSPRTESQLVPEVSGRVIWVSPSFASGGFFESGETLVKIDTFDYDQAVVTAGSELARARLAYAQEEAEAKVARKEWEELGAGDATPLTLREPQLADAEASVRSAEASLERAKRNLDRTRLRAPYAGRVRQKSVDVGQYVLLGSPVATIYSVDVAEIRLPLPDDELAYVDLPLTYRGRGATLVQPNVRVFADFAGRRHVWQGKIVRTEGEIDPVSRMVHAVAEVNNPYGVGTDPNRPPLNAGMFVQAEIEGRQFEQIARLPRTALRADARVWVVDPDDKLRYREVKVVRRTDSHVYISEGLDPGERVCLSALEATTDGMAVRVASDKRERDAGASQ